jgi:hypothetical protein
MADKGKKVKRFGGRWIREGEQFQERGRGLRSVFGRFWYLLVPFLGIMYAHDSYVRPQVEDVKSIKNIERKATLDGQDDLRAQISGIQSETQTVSAELDTLHLPWVRFFQARYDSLLAIRSIYDETLPTTKATIDSLRVLNVEIESELVQLSTTYQERAAHLEEQRAWQVSLKDSIEVLDDLITLETDDLYRRRHPVEYRKNEALFGGEGEYPRRDENPVREGAK